MAYTRVWTKNNPPGNQAANTADDEIRAFREDVEERMATLVTGWTTGAPLDPIVPVPAILGNVASKTFTAHHSGFRYVEQGGAPFNLATTIDIRTQYTENTDAVVTLLAELTLPIPPGCTITQIQLQANRNGAVNMTAELRSITRDSLATVSGVLATVSTDGPGVNLFLSAIVAELVSSTKSYVVQVSMPPASRLYSFAVVYSTPDCRSTL